MDLSLKTDRFKHRAFTKSVRLLTKGKDGPGPYEYDTFVKRHEGASLRMNPKAGFTKAKRQIDVIKCKYWGFQEGVIWLCFVV